MKGDVAAYVAFRLGCFLLSELLLERRRIAGHLDVAAAAEGAAGDLDQPTLSG